MDLRWGRCSCSWLCVSERWCGGVKAVILRALLPHKLFSSDVFYYFNDLEFLTSLHVDLLELVGKRL